MIRTVGLLLLVLGVIFPPGAVHAGAAKKVKQGIAHYRAGDFKKAANAFTEADVAKPDDDLIAFDRACAYAAQGDVQKAGQLWRAASLSRDTSLAVRCHYNLGGLASGQARVAFGEAPEDATPEVRESGLRLLQAAVGHYRNCIELDPDHAEARHNLELIRLWIKQMEDLWRQRDRQEQRDEMNLLAFLLMIEARERTLRSTAGSLADEPDSPQRRQALSATSSAQRELSQEIQPLKEKISAALQPAAPPGGASATGGPSSPPPPDESLEKVISLLAQLADDVHRAMQTAADDLDGGSIDDAVGGQADAVAGLDQIYMVVVPFPDMVTRGVSTQEGLIHRVDPTVQSSDATEGSETETGEREGTETEDTEGGKAGKEEDKDDEPAADRVELDASEAAWDQRFVAGWGGILPGKAENGIQNLGSADPAATAGITAGDLMQPSPADPGASQKQQAQQEQLEQLKAAMEKAIELGPEIQALADDAADHLHKEESADALPKQKEALTLWKAIADLLPKQEQAEQCENPKQGESQNDQQEQQDEEQKDQSQQQERQPNPQDVSQQEAESVLRRARDQEKKRRDLQKQAREYIFRAHAVERDW